MRTSDPVIPAAATSEETATTQIVLAFEDNKLASVLFGQYGQNLALIERRLAVVAEHRGNHVTINGSRGACEQARRVLSGRRAQVLRHDHNRGIGAALKTGVRATQAQWVTFMPAACR